MKLVLVFLFLSQIIFGQTDWYRWEKAETNYEISLINESNNHDDSSFGSSVSKDKLKPEYGHLYYDTPMSYKQHTSNSLKCTEYVCQCTLAFFRQEKAF